MEVATVMNYLYVAIGSAVGGMARFTLSGWAGERLGGRPVVATSAPFPLGTLFVNVTGSFLIGVLLIIAARRGSSADFVYHLLMVGFCGGYTTFSAFSADTVRLIENGSSVMALANVAASVVLALGATFLGMVVARVALGRA